MAYDSLSNITDSTFNCFAIALAVVICWPGIYIVSQMGGHGVLTPFELVDTRFGVDVGTSPLPCCPSCSGLLPQVAQAQQARLDRWLNNTIRILVIEMGAGRNVPTVRHFSQGIGMPLIRINPTDPELDGATGVSLRLGALEALRTIDAVLTR